MRILLMLFMSLAVVVIAALQLNLERDNGEELMMNSLLPKYLAFGSQTSVISSLVDKTVELTVKLSVIIAKKYLEKTQPIEIADKELFEFEWTNVKGEFMYENITTINPSEVELKKVHSHVSNKTLELSLFFSELKVKRIRYKTNVTVSKLTNIQRKGFIKANFTNLIVNASLSYGIKDKKIVCNTLNMSYSFDDVKVKITGLKFPKALSKDLESVINEGVAAYLRENEPTISKKIAKKIRKKINGNTDFELLKRDMDLVEKLEKSSSDFFLSRNLNEAIETLLKDSEQNSV